MTGPETPSVNLESIEVVTEVEEYPDLSHLGEFSDTPGPDDRTIDRRERGTQGRGELRYFVAAHSPEETGNPESVEQDWERMEAYGTTWHHIGVRAVAKVHVARTTQTIESSGLWGIASDSDEEYLNRVAQNELTELRQVLGGFGVELPETVEWADDSVVSGPVTENARTLSRFEGAACGDEKERHGP